MSGLKLTLVAVTGLAVTAAAFLPERATLLIDADTPVLDRVAVSQNQKEIGVLRAGTRVPVQRCEDVKTTAFFKVRLADGRNGYVEMGTSYRREIRSYWSAPFSSSLVFNCL